MSYAAQANFGNYDPSSFGWPHQVPDLVPFTFEGVNFGQCARAALPVFTAILTELVPHIPGGIQAVLAVRDDWAYSTTDDLPDGSWSFHRYGIAFDLDWSKNPMGDYSTNPDAGQQGAIPHDIASAIATKYGCEYGGDWSGGEGHVGFKDYMHFEIHLSPAVARTVTLLEDDMSAADVKAINDHIDGKFKGADGRPWPIENLILEVVKPKFAQLEADVAELKADNAAMKATLTAIAKKVGAA